MNDEYIKAINNEEDVFELFNEYYNLVKSLKISNKSQKKIILQIDLIVKRIKEVLDSNK